MEEDFGYGCGGITLGGVCRTDGDNAYLCKDCIKKLVAQLEAAQQSVQADTPSAHV